MSAGVGRRTESRGRGVKTAPLQVIDTLREDRNEAFLVPQNFDRRKLLPAAGTERVHHVRAVMSHDGAVTSSTHRPLIAT